MLDLLSLHCILRVPDVMRDELLNSDAPDRLQLGIRNVLDLAHQPVDILN